MGRLVRDYATKRLSVGNFEKMFQVEKENEEYVDDVATIFGGFINTRSEMAFLTTTNTPGGFLLLLAFEF